MALYLQENQIKRIDLTNFPLLAYVYLADNQISELNIAKNPGLYEIITDNNLLSKLDIRNNPKLRVIYVDEDVDLVMTEEQKYYTPIELKLPDGPPPQISK